MTKLPLLVWLGLLWPAASAQAGVCVDYGDFIHLEGIADTPDTAWALAQAGSLVCVADNDGGLRLIDVTDPAHPTPLGFVDTPGKARGVAVAGHLAFVADGPAGLQVVDIADPDAPELLGTLDTPDWARAVAVSGDLVYVADGLGGLLTVDTTDPAHPELLGSVDTPGFARHVSLAGSLAFVAVGVEAGLQVVDVSDPAHPAVVGSLDTSGSAFSTLADGDRVYLADGHSGLRVVDVADPAAPQIVATVEGIGEVYGLALVGDLLYTTDGFLNVFAIDVSDPVHPEQVGGVTVVGQGYALAGDGDRVYVADGTSGLQVVSAPSPSSPEVIGSLDTAGENYGIALGGPLAYLLQSVSGNSRLRVLDLARPGDPVAVADLYLAAEPPEGFGSSVVARDGLVYLADRYLDIVDVSHPEKPVLKGRAVTGNAHGVVLSGDYAYVADYVTGLRVVDVSDPSHPRIAATVDATFARSVAVTDDFAYVASGAGLKVVDISNPEVPTPRGFLATPQAMGVAVSGSYAYVADYGEGLLVVDVSNPDAPVLRATASLPTVTYGAVSVSGNSVTVAVTLTGLEVVDVSDPEAPFLVGGGLVLGHDIRAFARADSVFVAADRYFTVSIVPAHCSESTAVRLLSFTAAPAADGIDVRWSASEDGGHLGYHLHRSEGGGAYRRITPELVLPPGPYHVYDGEVAAGTRYAYRLQAVDRAGGSEWFGPVGARAGLGETGPPVLSVGPNPFRSAASIVYGLRAPGPVRLTVFDTAGKRVRTLVDGNRDAGAHTEAWDGRDDRGNPAPPGIYFIRLEADGASRALRVVRLDP